MKMLRITLEGKTYEVGVEVLDQATPAPAPIPPGTPVLAPSPTSPPSSAPLTAAPAVAHTEGVCVVASPMAGHVFSCVVQPGDVVAVNQVVVVLDAMKMETPVVSPFAGMVRSVLVKKGDAVDEGHPLVQIDVSR